MRATTSFDILLSLLPTTDRAADFRSPHDYGNDDYCYHQNNDPGMTFGLLLRKRCQNGELSHLGPLRERARAEPDSPFLFSEAADNIHLTAFACNGSR